MKMKNTFMALMATMLMVSCAHQGAQYVDREIASEKGNETGNPLMANCLGNVDKELDPVVLTEKFKVQIVREKEYLLEYDVRDMCGSRVAGFDTHCQHTKAYKLESGPNKNKYEAVATPILNEKFLKNYRKYIVCNRLIACEQNAALNPDISTDTLDRIHRVYENSKCDSVTVDVVENKIVRIVEERVPAKEPVKPSVPVYNPKTPVVVSPPVTPNRDPNAQFCQLRSTMAKCTELGGVCEWIAPSQGFCQARPGVRDPNADFCQLRSTMAKCTELGGVCQWNAPTQGYCQAR